MIEGEKYISEIHIRKVRNQEFGGEPTPFDDPVKLKFKIDRTGFDRLTSSMSDAAINYYEKEASPF